MGFSPRTQDEVDQEAIEAYQSPELRRARPEVRDRYKRLQLHRARKRARLPGFAQMGLESDHGRQS